MNDSKKRGVIMDLCLLGFMTVVLLTAIFMAIGPLGFFFNLICLMVTFILVIITYFTSIVTGLIFNLLFFFAQLVYVFYVSMYKDGFSLGYVFWLIVPPVLCLLIYGITLRLREQIAENIQLRRSNTRLTALDQETNLRTLNMFDEDFSVLAMGTQDHPTQLNMMIIRIRYWDSLKSRLTNDQTKELIHMITEQVNTCYNDQNFKYIIDHSVPTWGVLTFHEMNELKVIRARLKEDLQKKVATSEILGSLKIELIISIANYDKEENKTSTDLLAAGIRELQYDV
ncbi:diguanylate cyclase [Enterococcus sp. BWR-S5]|uniref:diguanylate cyclase n=1 Tax=Enterococcus sp. BWR-S5 TaxID=2787714 RepID=UPI001924E8FA|nr:diguanylate cyclase [Enterococcus sp. BWR-S5]MBL1225970.1 diguanylate cyclase [Enterococcus sp. BWR-S5]